VDLSSAPPPVRRGFYFLDNCVLSIGRGYNDVFVSVVQSQAPIKGRREGAEPFESRSLRVGCLGESNTRVNASLRILEIDGDHFVVCSLLFFVVCYL
jgi:hypothetical protein